MTIKYHSKALFGSLVLGSSLLISGCVENLSADDIVNMGQKGAQALSLTDSDVQEMSNQSCSELDRTNRIAANNSTYARRLNTIKAGLPTKVNGVNLNYKVYLVKDVNAFAMPNGCIRVYAGLMDYMTDDEVRGVLGHEIGHVELGHSKNSFRMAALTELGRDFLNQHSSSKVAALSRSQLGDVAEGFMNAQFSQSQEKSADNYSYELHVKQNRDAMPIATAFEKLAKLGSSSSIFSSHPSSESRAKNIRSRIASDKR